MGTKTVCHSPYSRNLDPCDLWLFPKLRGCRYETIEEMKEAVMKVIDTLTQEDFHGAFEKLLERYNKCIHSFTIFITYIIIIIISCRQHGYPRPSLATSPYHSSPPAGPLGYIPCPHIAAVCMFGLVVLLLLGHMWESIGACHLWARPCFSSSVRRVWLVWPV